MKKLFMLMVFLLAAGCASYTPVPADYTGPIASISDSGRVEGASKAQLFVIAEIDGQRIDNSFKASAQASYGQGLALRTRYVERKIPARPMKVKLEGSHITGAPIHALISQAAGTFFSVEGVIDFSPKPNGQYVVKGELKKEGSSVWIEDMETGERVGDKISGK
ncbi:hypothetical protein [Uliginosibacterium sediminicola]|uniref:Lipoprotein n=1 Tax=Uliginosibacterium sediminicola TaxID=2024550 RepID=A0ABU9YXR8_9RHOO